MVNALSSPEHQCTDIAEVVSGVSTKLSSLQLPQDTLLKLLLCLMVRSKEVTSATLKEYTSGYQYDDDYMKQQHLCETYKNIDLAVAAITEYRNNKMYDQERSLHGESCRTYLYMAMYCLGMSFLDIKACLAVVDLKSLRAEQALVLIVNSVDLLQAHILHEPSPTVNVGNSPFSALAEKITKILEVINRSVNLLEPSCAYVTRNKAIIYKIVASINILNRLVINPGCESISPYEVYVILNLIGKRLGIFKAKLEGVLYSSSSGRVNKMLGHIAYAALTYYEHVADSALRSRSLLTLPYHRYSSLAFCLVRSVSLAFENHMLHSIKNSSQNGAKVLMPRAVTKKICDKIFTSIIAYYRQTQLQEKLPKTAENTNYHTCLDYIEGALRDVRTAKPKALSYDNLVHKRLQILEEALMESEKLCTSTLKNETAFSEDMDPSSLLDIDVSVLACFCGTHQAISWDSIDEEVCLQGRGRGGEIRTLMAQERRVHWEDQHSRLCNI